MAERARVSGSRRSPRFTELVGIGWGGFRLDADSALLAMRADPGLQVARASCVFGLRHLASAVRLARRAQAEGTNRAHDLRTEFLLFLTGQRQVGEAIRTAGVGEGQVEAVAVSFSGRRTLGRIARDSRWVRDNSLIDPTERKLRGAGFTDTEIAAAPQPMLLPLERTAMLVVQR